MIFAMAVLLIAAVAAPSFAAPASPYEQQVLQVRYDMVSARVGFTTGVMADVVSLVPQASDLGAHIEKLNADLATLNGYVTANDRQGFNGFVCGTIQPDMKAAHEALRTDRSHFREWNVTVETRQQLKADYERRKAMFEAQIRACVLELGGIRVDYYNDVLARNDARVANLSDRGVDVSGMLNVKAGAQSNVIGPLQSAVNAGDANATRDELRGKCLGNGAPYSFHYWAKTDLEALKGITARIADNATRAGHGDDIASINTKLATVEGTLAVVGTSPYTEEQQEAIWDNLKAASEELRALLQELRGSR